jgi:hypothetical protein
MTGNTISGTGDDVVRVDRSGATTFQHDGTSNLAVWSYQAIGNTNNRDLEINTIGAYAGTVAIDAGTVYLDITADGNRPAVFP